MNLIPVRQWSLGALLSQSISGKPLKNIILLTFAALTAQLGLAPAATAEVIEGGVTFELGIGRDSNVAIDDLDLSISQGDHFTDIGGSLDLKYSPDERTDLGASLTVSEKAYHEFSEFDGQLVLASLRADRKIGDVTAGLTLRDINYDLDESRFLRLQQVAPSLSWFPAQKVYVRLDYEWSDETYFVAPDRNNEQQSLSLSTYLFINGLRHYWTVRGKFSRDKADNPTFSNDARELRLLYHRGFSLMKADASIDLIYRFQQRNFMEAREPTIDDFRIDRRGRYEARLNIPVGERFEISLRYSSADYRSNLDAAAFSQNLFQLKLSYEVPF